MANSGDRTSNAHSPTTMLGTAASSSMKVDAAAATLRGTNSERATAAPSPMGADEQHGCPRSQHGADDEDAGRILPGGGRPGARPYKAQAVVGEGSGRARRHADHDGDDDGAEKGAPNEVRRPVSTAALSALPA